MTFQNKILIMELSYIYLKYVIKILKYMKIFNKN